MVFVALMTMFGTGTIARAGSSTPGNGSSEDTSFTGVVESLPASGLIGDWTVSGTVVHVTAATEIDEEGGPVAVGATVDVEGSTGTDGSITASQVDVAESADADSVGEVSFAGVIESMTAGGTIGDWVVSGTTVHVTVATEINAEDGAAIVVGTPVEVQGLSESDGSITASSIDAQSSVSEASISLTGTLGHRSGMIGTWRVSHHVVHVDRATKVLRHGHKLTSGSTLRVDGRLRKDGSISAARITVRG